MLDALALAQQTSKPLSIGPYLFMVMGAIAVLVLGGLAVLYLRRRVLEQERAISSAGSFMEQLREMYRKGQISEAEYERTRKAMAAKVSVKMDTRRSNGLFEMPDTRPRPQPPAQGTTRINAPLEVQAPPGYDLTGAPLPKPTDTPSTGDPHGPNERPPPPPPLKPKDG